MATLRDVAALAGVSTATVSRALSPGTSHAVALETRERIDEIARQLNYAPNDAARRLARRSEPALRPTHSIGLVQSTADATVFSDPYWSRVFDGVNQELIRQRYQLAFAFSSADLAHPRQRRLVSRAHVDGVILVGALFPEVASLGLERTVLLESGDDRICRAEPLPLDVITIDKKRAMHHLIDHLVGLGHRRFSFLGPPAALDSRTAAFFEALGRHGLSVEQEFVKEVHWTADAAYPVARDLLRRPLRPDVFVCGCDSIAIGAMRAAKDGGLRLPQDLAVTGWDDIAFAGDLDPPLTTIGVNKELLGWLAVRKLIERLAWPALPPVIQIVPTALVVRASCGASPRQVASADKSAPHGQGEGG